tara:strand:+ start:3778 stop:4029 length:252 start_codon:yes stop_codon:yes gene_type:complete
MPLYGIGAQTLGDISLPVQNQKYGGVKKAKDAIDSHPSDTGCGGLCTKSLTCPYTTCVWDLSFEQRCETLKSWRRPLTKTPAR